MTELGHCVLASFLIRLEIVQRLGQANAGGGAFVHNLSTSASIELPVMICSFSDWCPGEVTRERRSGFPGSFPSALVEAFRSQNPIVMSSSLPMPEVMQDS